MTTSFHSNRMNGWNTSRKNIPSASDGRFIAWRADIVRRDPEIVSLLKKAGIKSISMSIESGNPFIREQIFKRGMTEDDIRYAFELCHKNDINTFSNTILAVPAPIIPDPR